MMRKGFDPRPLFFQLSWKEIFTSWGVVVIFFALFFLCVFEVPKLGNVFHVSGLLKIGAVVGLVLGAIIAFFLSKNVSDLTDRMKISIFVIVPCLIFVPLLACVLNRLGSDDGRKEEFEIFEAEKIGAEEKSQKNQLKEGDYFIYVFHESELEKLRFNDLIEEPQKGQTIDIKIRTGAFGWEWADHIFAR